MKKVLSLLLILMFVLSSVSMVYANTDLTYVQLKELGYTDNMIKFLDEEEKAEIIENQYAFIGESVGHTLFINEVKKFDNGNKIIKTYATDINEIEKTKLEILNKSLFKNKEYKESFLKEKLELLKAAKIEPEIYYLNSKDEVVSESYVINSTSYAENYLEDCVLSTGVYAYDKSTSTRCIKRLGYNFQWDGIPAWALHDLLAISHTGVGMGLTNIEQYGGTYTYIDAVNTEHSLPIAIDPETYGITGEFDMKMAGTSWGEMYVDISNNKSAVTPNGLFYMCAQYGHVKGTLGATVSVGASGAITFNPYLTSTVTKSTKLMYNNIFTY